MTPLKIIFAGTPAFAAAALQALIDSPHDIVAVYTQPDKPAGRGLKILASDVKQLALQHNLTIHQPKTLRDAEQQAILAAYNADVMVVAAYGLILPQAVLDAPKRGCLNIHSSLLPRWRGAAPIQRAIEAGDRETGITIMQMEAGLDTGPMLLQYAEVIEENDTAKTLHDRLADLGAKAIVDALEQLCVGALHAEQQDETHVTYAHKISKQEAEIDWSLPAADIYNRIRAFNPWPVCFTNWHHEPLRIWQAAVVYHAHQAAPGTILEANKKQIIIAAGRDAIQLLEVQLPGKKPMRAQDFYNAKQQLLQVGQPFNSV